MKVVRPLLFNTFFLLSFLSLQSSAFSGHRRQLTTTTTSASTSTSTSDSTSSTTSTTPTDTTTTTSTTPTTTERPTTTAPPTTTQAPPATTQAPPTTTAPQVTTVNGVETTVTITNPTGPPTPSASPSAPATSPDDDETSGLGTGSIIGLSVAGGIAVIGIISFFVWKFTRKRFSDMEGDEAIKWPDLNTHNGAGDLTSHPLPVHNTGRTGFDTGSEGSLSRVNSSTNYSTADFNGGVHDPYAVPPLPHLNPNQPYRDDPAVAGAYYDPYHGPVPGTIEHSGAVQDWSGEAIPMTQMNPAPGRMSPGPQLAYEGRQSPGPYTAYGGGRSSPGPQAAYAGRMSPGPHAVYGGVPPPAGYDSYSGR